MTLCVHRLSEYGTSVPKHVGVTLTINCFFMICLYFILLSSFVGQFVEHMKMYGLSNIKIITMILLYAAEGTNGI